MPIATKFEVHFSEILLPYEYKMGLEIKIHQWSFEKLRFQDFYLMKQGQNWQVLEVKLLKEVPFKVIHCKKCSNTFLLHIHFKKKMGLVFGWVPLFHWEGEISNFTLFTIKGKITPPPSGTRGLIQKLTPFFFLKWVWGRKVLLFFLQ